MSKEHSSDREAPGRRNGDHTLKLIQQAAQACFLSKGYKETRIRDIAAAAGVSPAAIYMYFENKEELFNSLDIPEARELNPEHERQQAEVMRVALFLFSSKGFQKTSMKEIADAAKISKATLYKFCDSKEALLAKVFQSSSFNILARQHFNPTDGDWRENVKAFGRTYLQLTHEPERIALLRCVISESHNYPEIGQLYYQQGYLDACRAVVSYLQQLIDSSRLQLREGFDLLTAVHTYFGSLQSFLVLSGMVPGRYFNVDMEKYLNMSTEVFLNGVFEELT